MTTLNKNPTTRSSDAQWAWELTIGLEAAWTTLQALSPE
jgi:hypothetical protein